MLNTHHGLYCDIKSTQQRVFSMSGLINIVKIAGDMTDVGAIPISVIFTCLSPSNQKIKRFLSPQLFNAPQNQTGCPHNYDTGICLS